MPSHSEGSDLNSVLISGGPQARHWGRARQCDVVIVGAGPAGLATAFAVLRRAPSARILLLEKGHTFEDRRRCGYLQSGLCSCGLNPCAVLHGVGGASFLFGSKLSEFPAGSGFGRLVGDVAYRRFLQEAVRLLAAHGLPPLVDQTNGDLRRPFEEAARRNGIRFKHYPSHYVEPDTNHRLVQSMQDSLLRLGVTTRVHTEFLGFGDRDGSGMLRVKCSAAASPEEFRARFLVLALGEAGAVWLNRNRSRLRHVDGPVDIGVRLEVCRDGGDDVTRVHNDMKLSLLAPDGTEVRTYCCSTAADMVPCRQASFAVVDGARTASSAGAGLALTVFNRTFLVLLC